MSELTPELAARMLDAWGPRRYLVREDRTLASLAELRRLLWQPTYDRAGTIAHHVGMGVHDVRAVLAAAFDRSE